MNKELLKIRKVNSSDAREWFIFLFKVWRDAYKDIFPEEVFIDRESKLEEKVKDFDNKLQNNERSIAYVAEYDGKMVGTMCGSISSSYDHFDKYADLIGLYIDPNFQGYGIGTTFKNTFFFGIISLIVVTSQVVLNLDIVSASVIMLLFLDSIILAFSFMHFIILNGARKPSKTIVGFVTFGIVLIMVAIAMAIVCKLQNIREGGLLYE